MNQVQLFIHEQLGDVRIIPSETGNQLDTLFCAVDVTRALGYDVNNHRNIVSRYCRYVTQHNVPHPQNPTKTLKVNFIPLSDVFGLVFGSRRPEAEEFRRWISEEVLPSIYMTGDFIGTEHNPPIQSNPTYQLSEEELNYVINNPDCTTTYIYDNYGESGSFDNRNLLQAIGQMFLVSHRQMSEAINLLYQNQENISNDINNLSQQINDIKDKPNMIIPARIVK